MCGWRRKSILSGISHLQCEWRKCALPEGSHLQSDSVRVCHIRRATFVIESPGVWCEEKLCNIRKVSSVV